MTEDELKKIYGLQKLLFLGRMHKEGQDFNKLNKPLGNYQENLIANGAGTLTLIYRTSPELTQLYLRDSLVPENIKPDVVLGKIINSKPR